MMAHRAVFEDVYGWVPESVDHMCHDPWECSDAGELCPHRVCCNPAHLSGESLAENARRNRVGVRAPMCRAGHAITPENTYETEDGARRCRACAAKAARDRRARVSERRSVTGPRRSRPRGLGVEATVVWGLEGNDGDGCWSWGGGTSVGGGGYVSVRVGGERWSAHRLVYVVRVGPIPDGHVVDHTCHDPEVCEGGLTCPHRACVNPDHLTAVSPAVNTSTARARRPYATTCKRGHPFTEENTFVNSAGNRSCRACTNERQRAYREQAKGPDRRYREGGVCRNGHDTAVCGVNSRGRCVECARERNRRYEARHSGPRH